MGKIKKILKTYSTYVRMVLWLIYSSSLEETHLESNLEMRCTNANFHIKHMRSVVFLVVYGTNKSPIIVLSMIPIARPKYKSRKNNAVHYTFLNPHSNLF